MLPELARHESIFLLQPREMDSVGVSGGPENSAGGNAGGMLHSDEKFVLNGLY